MFSQGTEAARRLCAMYGNAFQAMIENANGLAVPANPDVVAQVFSGNRVIRTIDGDMTITRNPTLRLFVKRKTVVWKWIQTSLLDALEGHP